MPIEQEHIIPNESSTNLTQSNWDNLALPTLSQRQLALSDIKESIQKWPLWMMLAYQDIKLRYRRSILGPFWLTLSMAITVYTMGFLYSHLFHIEMQHYFPFLVSGMLTWTLLSSLIVEFTDGFVLFDFFIKQTKLPYSLYIHRITTRNIIIFFHNMLVIVPVLFIFHQSIPINLNMLFLIPGLLIIYFNAITYGLTLAMLGARYRDISQIIKSFIQVVFFVTPVLWSPEVLGEKHYYIVDLNPFYAFIELVRAPLLGKLPTLNSFIMVACVSLMGIIISTQFFSRYRSRIIYWL